jgi:hypothetical protein
LLRRCIVFFFIGVRGNRGKPGNIHGNSRGRGGRDGKNSEKKMPYKDELDAQLDRYIKFNKIKNN